MEQFKSLLVIWQDKKTNLYYHVGTLNYDGKKYNYTYTVKSGAHRKVREAMTNGYNPHPAFPELEKEYVSDELFLAFDRRIPSSDRVDYENILNNLGLPTNADRMDILRETRGMLSGDSYSFEEPLRLKQDNSLQTNFYINGMRHINLADGWESKIHIGDKLIALHEPNNSNDPYAVRIETIEGVHIGYVPGIYAMAVSALLRNQVKLYLTVMSIKPKLGPKWWVRVGLDANIDLEQSYLSDEIELEGLIQRIA